MGEGRGLLLPLRARRAVARRLRVEARVAPADVDSYDLPAPAQLALHAAQAQRQRGFGLHEPHGEVGAPPQHTVMLRQRQRMRNVAVCAGLHLLPVGRVPRSNPLLLQSVDAFQRVSGGAHVQRVRALVVRLEVAAETEFAAAVMRAVAPGPSAAQMRINGDFAAEPQRREIVVKWFDFRGVGNAEGSAT